MIDDMETFKAVPEYKNTSLVQQILRIQDLELPMPKSFVWMRRLVCLSVEGLPRLTKQNRHQIVLQEVEVNLFSTDVVHYVTVSYTSNPVKGESDRKGNFWVQTLDGRRMRTKVRDVVIRRMIRYVQHHELKGFWIDQQSLDQDDERQHAIAMHSMDRLYAESPRSVGLTTTRIKHQWQIDVLQCLLTGSLSQDTGSEANENVLSIPVVYRFWRMLRWLVHLLSDGWWDRAWIFQEEYCAGRKMWILIPCEQHLSRRGDLFGSMPGEVEISAIDLRTELTKFAIACRDGVKPRQKHYIERCIVRRAERYQVSYQYGRCRDHNLSSLTSTDLQRRDIDRPEDYLAILANCCGYTRRVDHRQIKSHRHLSLPLALFVQALLNGEIIRNGSDCQRASTLGFSEFFRGHIVTDIKPPSEQDTLTFTKRCRFVSVQLCVDGVTTRGHLWRTVGSVPIVTSGRQYLLSSSVGLQMCLRDLARVLQPLQPALASSIHQFTTTLEHQLCDAWQTELMTAMAKEVVQAWTTRRSLCFASLDGTDQGSAIFVADEPDKLFFTSWHDTADESGRDDSEPLRKHVWLAVESSSLAIDDEIPRLRVSRWVHGLCFLQSEITQLVMFPWPSSWTSPPNV